MSGIHSYREGDSLAIVGPRKLCLLDSSVTDEMRYRIIDRILGPGSVVDVLDELVRPGLMVVSGFALAEVAEHSVRVIVRGPWQARFQNGEVVSGAGVWTDRVVESPLLAVGDLASTGPIWPLSVGAVRSDLILVDVASFDEVAGPEVDGPEVAGREADGPEDISAAVDAAAGVASTRGTGVVDGGPGRADVAAVQPETPVASQEARTEVLAVESVAKPGPQVAAAEVEVAAAEVAAAVEVAAAETQAKPGEIAKVKEPNPYATPALATPAQAPAAQGPDEDDNCPNYDFLFGITYTPRDLAELRQLAAESSSGIGPTKVEPIVGEAAATAGSAPSTAKADPDPVLTLSADQLGLSVEDSIGRCQVAAIAQKTSPHLVFSHGLVVTLDMSCVIGRRPQPPPQLATQVRLVKIDDASKEMSSSHVMVLCRPNSVELIDLGSLNGTFITRPDRLTEQLVAHVPMILADHTTVTLGGGYSFVYRQ